MQKKRNVEHQNLNRTFEASVARIVFDYSSTIGNEDNVQIKNINYQYILLRDK